MAHFWWELSSSLAPATFSLCPLVAPREKGRELSHVSDFLKIEVYLTYNTILVSGIQHNDSIFVHIAE